MIRKALAIICCLALLVTGPGAQLLSAQPSRQPAATEIQNVLIGSQEVSVLNSSDSRPIPPADIADLQAKIQKLQVGPGMRDRALQVIERLSHLNGRSAEVSAAIRKFREELRLNDPRTDQEFVLSHLMDGVQPYLAYADKSADVKQVTVNDGTTHCERIFNHGRYMHEDCQTLLAPKFARVVVMIPDPNPENDPKREGQDILGAVEFLDDRDGHKVKIAWSRELFDYANGLKASWFDMVSTQDRLEDGDIKDSTKNLLRDQRDGRRKKYLKETQIDEIIRELDPANAERLRTGTFTPQQIDEFNEHLLDSQIRMQNFEATEGLHELQKKLLYNLMDYFVESLKLEANPVSEKDLLNMTPKAIQDQLTIFQDGAISDNGLFGVIWRKALGIGKIRPDSDKDDPEAHMPRALRQAVSLTIRYLGLAVQAQERMDKTTKAWEEPFKPAPIASKNAQEAQEELKRQITAFNEKKAVLNKQRDVARSELLEWTQQAIEQLELYEFYQKSVALENVKDGTDPQDIRLLRPQSIATAKHLINSVQQLGRNGDDYRELEAQTFKNLLYEAAATFRITFGNARDMKLTKEGLQEPVATLLAKAQEMKDFFLCMKYQEFATGDKSEANFAAYRKWHSKSAEEGDNTYYKDQAEGGLFKFFQQNLDQQSKNTLSHFGDIIAKLNGMMAKLQSRDGDVSSAREVLDQMRDEIVGLFNDLQLKKIPNTRDIEKEEQRLAASRETLNNAARSIYSKMDVFLMANMLYFSNKKDSSEILIETQPRGWYDRFTRRVGWVLNCGGAGDWTGDRAIQLARPFAYQMLHSKMGKARLDQIMNLMDEGKFSEAFAKIQDLDPKAAKREVLRSWLDRDHDAADEYLKLKKVYSAISDDQMDRIISGAKARQEKKARESATGLMTQPLSDETVTAVEGAMDSAFTQLERCHFWYTVGKGAWDFVIMIPLTAIAGPVISAVWKGVGTVVKVIGEVATYRAEAEAALGLRAWTLATRVAFPVRWSGYLLRGAGNIMIHGGEHFTKSLGIAKWMEMGNGYARTSWEIGKAAMYYNGMQVVGIGSFGAFNTAVNYALHPAYYPDGVWSTMRDDAIYNAAWAIDNGWEFSFIQVPGATISGTNVLARAYQVFGRAVGPLSALIGAAAKAVNGLWSNSLTKSLLEIVPLSDKIGYLARAIVTHEGENGIKDGFVGFMGSSIDGIKSNGGRMLASAALGAYGYADNLFKFGLFTTGVQTMTQYGVYSYNYYIGHPIARYFHDDSKDAKPKSDFAPTQHVQDQALAREWGMSAINIAFMMIPNFSTPLSPHEMAEQRKVGGRFSKVNRSTKEYNRYHATAPSNAEAQKGEIGFWEAPVRWTLRTVFSLGLLGPEKAALPVAGGMKTQGAQTVLRRAKYTATELLGILMVIKENKDQRPYTRAELRDIGSGKIKAADLRPLTPEEVEERLNSDDSFLVDEHRDAFDREQFNKYLDGGMKEQDKPKALTPEEIKDRLKGNNVTFVIGELETAADKLLAEKLQKDQKLADKIVKAENTLDLDGETITDPSTIKQIQKIAEEVKIIANIHELRGGVLRKLRNAEEGGRPLEAEKLREIFGYSDGNGLHRGVWDDLKDNITARDESLAITMEKNRDILMTEFLLDYNMDCLNRHIGRAKTKLEIKAERRRVVRTVNEILSFGGIKNPRTGEAIPRLRWDQVKALMEFVDAVLQGKSPDDCLKIFTELKASGGKTLLMKVSMIPLEIVRGRNYSAGFFERRWDWVRGGNRELWLLTSNPHLVRQMEDDWRPLSGGLRPTFRIGSWSDLHSAELERKVRGERSIGVERNVIMDEADAPIEEPSLMVGDPTGSLSWGNPVLKVLMSCMDWVSGRIRYHEVNREAIEARVSQEVVRHERDIRINELRENFDERLRERLQSELQKDITVARAEALQAEVRAELQAEIDRLERGEADADIRHDIADVEFRHMIESAISKEIPGQARQQAEVWEQIMGNLSGEIDTEALLQKGWTKERIKAMKKEAKNAKRIIQALYGRFYVERTPENLGRSYLGLLLKKIEDKGGIFAWFNDDGVETYLRIQLTNQLKTLNLEDDTTKFNIDTDKRKVTQIHYGKMMPTLNTEFQGPAQLLLMKELETTGARWEENKPVRFDLPMRDKGILTFGELIERFTKLGRGDLLFTSGTAAPDVQSGLMQKIRMLFANVIRGSKLPPGITYEVTGAGHRVDSSVAANSGNFSADPDYQRIIVKIPRGTRYDHPENVQDTLYRALQTTRKHEAKRAKAKEALGFLEKNQLQVSDLENAMVLLEQIPGHANAVKNIRALLENGKIGDAKTEVKKLADGKVLIMLAPRSLAELKILEKAILDSHLATEPEIVRFFPDYVHQMKEQYEKKAMLEQNNIGALANGTAKFVLNVPEIGGRGTDMDLTKYTTLMAAVLEPEKRNITAIIQFFARFGDGRAKHAERTYYGVTSWSGLDSNRDYAAELRKTNRQPSQSRSVGIYEDMVPVLMNRNQRTVIEPSEVTSPPRIGVFPWFGGSRRAPESDPTAIPASRRPPVRAAAAAGATYIPGAGGDPSMN